MLTTKLYDYSKQLPKMKSLLEFVFHNTQDTYLFIDSRYDNFDTYSMMNRSFLLRILSEKGTNQEYSEFLALQKAFDWISHKISRDLSEEQCEARYIRSCSWLMRWRGN